MGGSSASVSTSVPVVIIFHLLGPGMAALDNIDRRLPILRHSPGLLNHTHLARHGPDQFGFALALHEIDEITDGDSAREAARKVRLVVGAPKGTYPGGLPLTDPGEPALNNTGLVFDCSVVPDRERPCGHLAGDPVTGVTLNGLDLTEDNDYLSAGERLFDHRPNAIIFNQFGNPKQGEQKIGQFLGAIVASLNERLVVCAPVWVSAGPYNSSIGRDGNSPASTHVLPTGRCYITNRQLREVSFLDPCNFAHERAGTVDRGYCTSGTDVDMLEPGRFIIGSPGYVLGIGTVFYGRTQAEMLMRSSPTAGAGNILHESDESGGPQQIRELSQGFQVATGFITSMRTDPPSPPPNVLASVPRFDGSVYLGKIDIYDARENGGNIRNLLHISARGTQIAENFGYSLDTLDINGDMYDDVVVGAPMYSQINTMSEVQVETGRVYVFINMAGTRFAESIPFDGAKARARLGTSVLSLGDIDQDGFEDFAAGAPYEPDGDSTGAVYIYYGNSDLTAFREQTPGRISSQATADHLSNMRKFKSFGFSLATLDFDNNKYNDLAVGAPDSGAAVMFRSRPVAKVDMDVILSTEAVVRASQNCSVNGTDYTCFTLTVHLAFSGKYLPREIEVNVSLREVHSKREERIFFGDNRDDNQIVQPVTLGPTGVFIVTVHLKNGITDSNSPLELMVEVLPNSISQPVSLGDGQPDIRDLSQDFLIRQPNTVTRLVNLTNNCGPENLCQTDFAIAIGEVSYLPDRGLGYETVEICVEIVRFSLTLSNLGSEDAIVLLLDIQHSVPGVFTNVVQIELESTVLDCMLSIGPCNVKDMLAGKSKEIGVVLEVASDPPVGLLTTTFTLQSSATTDTRSDNNNETVDLLVVDRRPSHTVSVTFHRERVGFGDSPVESPSVRSDVGALVSMEVRVSNVRSTDVDSALLSIFYPASAPETGDYFYLLPDCSVLIPISERGRIECKDSNSDLMDADSSLECDSARRRRHAVSPSVKQRWRAGRMRRQTDSDGLTRMFRATTSLDCSATPERCLVIRCNITGLRGLGRNEAKIFLQGFVDERFFFGKDQQYQLTAMANVTANAEVEGTFDQSIQPESDYATVIISPVTTSSITRGTTSEAALIAVIFADIAGASIILSIFTFFLWRFGFFKRKLKDEGKERETDGEEDGETDKGKEQNEQGGNGRDGEI